MVEKPSPGLFWQWGKFIAPIIMIPASSLIPAGSDFWLEVLRAYLIVGAVVYPVAFIVIGKKLSAPHSSEETRKHLPLKILLSYTAVALLLELVFLPFIVHRNLP